MKLATIAQLAAAMSTDGFAFIGAAAGKRAEILGGLLLIGIGATILYDHLGAA